MQKSMSYHEPIPGVHPFLGFVITLSVLLFGRFVPDLCILINNHLPILLHYHIPPLFIEGLQCIAYGGTGMIGMVTAYKFYDEKGRYIFKKKLNRKKKKQ